MEEQLTPEEIQGHINAAFDSVNLINEILAEPKDEKKEKTVERNYKHLEIMISKEWFSTALLPEQSQAINDAITNGKAY